MYSKRLIITRDRTEFVNKVQETANDRVYIAIQKLIEHNTEKVQTNQTRTTDYGRSRANTEQSF